MDQATLLLRDYDAYYQKTAYARKLKAQGRFVPPLKATPERLQALEQMAAWCRQRNLDPRHWLQSLFQGRRWLFAPFFDQLTSEKHLKKYAGLPTSPLYQQRIVGEWQTSQVRRSVVYDVNRDLSPSTESLKAQLLNRGDADRCMARMREDTLGYHPRSVVCARCSLARACERALRALAHFDIVALRQGTLTMEQAAAQERQHYYVTR